MKARFALVSLALITGCADRQGEERPPSAIRDPLPAYRRWADGVGQGGRPDGQAGYRALAELGYTTVISVDGAPPGDGAEGLGLRVVHVPIGYAGIEDDRALRIVRAAQLSEGPVYVHCHHGTHRGPAAAMLIRIALHGLSRAQGSSDLRLSGCSPNYQGLYESVESFEPPSAGALAALDPAELMSRVAPSNLVESMLEIEDALERLVECRTASNGSDSPDAAAAHEALLLREAFRELGRLERARGPGAGRGRASRFAELLSAAEETAGGLESRLRDSLGADDALRQVKQACVACHRGFRDR